MFERHLLEPCLVSLVSIIQYATHLESILLVVHTEQRDNEDKDETLLEVENGEYSRLDPQQPGNVPLEDSFCKSPLRREERVAFDAVELEEGI